MTLQRTLYSQLPATDRLLRDASFSPLLNEFGHTRVVSTLRDMLDSAREHIRVQGELPPWNDSWAVQARQRLEAGPAQRPAARF